MSKHIVILAGGKSQRPYVTEFQKRGWRVTVVDRDPNAVSKSDADVFIENSTYCLDTLIEKLTQENDTHKINGVFSNSSAGPVAHNVAELNRVFKTEYPGFSVTSVARSYSKLSMQEYLRNAKINVAQAFSPNSLHAENFPIVIKPGKNGLGGLGVKKIESLSALNHAIPSGDIQDWVYESYIEGDEYSVDGLVVDGTLEIISLSRKISGDRRDDFIPNRFELTPINTTPAFSEIYKQSSLAAKALDINNSQISLDIKIGQNGVVTVIECGLFWDSKIDRLWAYSGFNGYSYLIDRIFCNKAQRHDISLRSGAMEILYSDKETVLNESEINKKHPQDHIEFEKHTGDKVRPPLSVADMVACRFYQY